MTILNFGDHNVILKNWRDSKLVTVKRTKHVKTECEVVIDNFTILPDVALHRILSFIPLQDLGQVRQVSFFKGNIVCFFCI